MLFVIKKFLGLLLLPLSLSLIIMAAGLLLLWFSRWQRTGKSMVSLAWLLLLLLSIQPVADRLLTPLESAYPSWQGNPHSHYIVVLGGGYSWNPQFAPGSNLLNNNLPRVVEAVRLWRENPGATLIFTGAAAMHNPVSAAEAAARVAESLGVPRQAIVTLSRPKDTAQEAAAVAAFFHTLAANPRFLLVTSASHLPRAMRDFQHQGLRPIAVPANQLAINSPLNPWERTIPQAIWLQHSERAVYETLGGAWQKLTQ